MPWRLRGGTRFPIRGQSLLSNHDTAKSSNLLRTSRVWFPHICCVSHIAALSPCADLAGLTNTNGTRTSSSMHITIFTSRGTSTQHVTIHALGPSHTELYSPRLCNLEQVMRNSYRDIMPQLGSRRRQ